MNPDAQTADSSSASEQPAMALPSLESLSASEREAWRLTGELPAARSEEDPSTPADSTPAEPAAQAASTDATSSPDSEPGTPGKKAKSNADTRVQELLRERAELRDKLARYERGEASTPPPSQDAPSAASSPAPAGSEPFPDFDTWSARAEHEGKSYEEYIDARTEYRWTQRQEQERRQAAVRGRVSAFHERYAAASAADPTFATSLSPAVLALQPVDALPPGAPVTPLNVAAQEIVQSEHAPALLRHFSTHPDELEALRTAAPSVVIRAIAKLEARLDASAGTSTPTPTPKAITSAPEPPPTLGSKATAPLDEAAAAVARGDFTAYAAAQNRRETATA